MRSEFEFYERKQEEEIKTLKMILKDTKRVEYIGYRNKYVKNLIYLFRKVENYPELKKIEQSLFEEVGKKRQYDDVFKVELKKGGEFYIQLIDSYIKVGLSLT